MDNPWYWPPALMSVSQKRVSALSWQITGVIATPEISVME